MAVLNVPPESQFAYVVVVARRARQLMMGGRPLVDNPRSRKNTRIAEEELQRGLLEYEVPDLGEEGAGRAEAQHRLVSGLLLKERGDLLRRLGEICGDRDIRLRRLRGGR